jgi:ubiquitin C-terminal hydrolase
MDQFTATEYLSAQCEKCGGPDETADMHSKKLSFTRLPPVLVVSFKRFKNIHVKNETLISFPTTNFDVSKWVEDDGMGNRNNYMYDLVAVVNHSGRLGYGHYTAYGLTEQGSWALYDDENVTMVGTSEAGDFLSGVETAESLRLSEALVTRKAYLLVYVQRDSHTSKK